MTVLDVVLHVVIGIKQQIGDVCYDMVKLENRIDGSLMGTCSRTRGWSPLDGAVHTPRTVRWRERETEDFLNSC